MRITCPNCDAQYEVPEDVIPREGRDVQCSNCGQTWLQQHPDAIAETKSVDVIQDLSGPDSVAETNPAPDDVVVDTPPQPTAPPQRGLDPEVADILRQEAEREREARAHESAPLETQPDLGLDEGSSAADDRNRAVQERMSQIRGETPLEDTPQDPALGNIGDAAATAAAIGARRDLLPDIEEINSTLRSTSDRDIAGDDPDPEAPIVKRKKRGFRRGFLLAVLLIVSGVLVYAFAPDIVAQVPQADPWISRYVAWIDGLRVGLDNSVQGILTWLDAQAAASQSE